MTKGNIFAIIFFIIMVAAGIAVKVKYGGRVEITNETAETRLRDAKELEKKLRRNKDAGPEQWREIEEVYNDLLDTYPDSEEAPYAELKLAQLYSKGYEDYDRAIDKLRSVLTSYPDIDIRESVYDELISAATKKLKAGGNGREVLEIYDEYLREFPETRKADYLTFAKGIVFHSTGDIPSAERLFTDVITKFPKSRYVASAEYRLALIELGRGDAQRGRSMLWQVLRKHPDSQGAGLARKKLEEMGSTKVYAALKNYYQSIYGVDDPYRFSRAEALNSENVLSQIAEQQIDVRNYTLTVTLLPTAGGMEVSGDIELVNTGPSRSDLLFQLNKKVGQLVMTSHAESLDISRNGNLATVHLKEVLGPNQKIALHFKSATYPGNDPECTIFESGYALPQFLWYPATVPGDLFTCTLIANHPKDTVLIAVGDKVMGDELGKTEWKAGDKTAGVFFFYGRHHEATDKREGVDISYMKAPDSFTDTTEVFNNVAGVLEYFQDVFKLKSTDKLVLAETAIPENHLFVDAPGIVIFNKQSVGDRIPVDLLSYSLGHQYFGLLIPENPGPEYTAFLSEGFQSYFETLYTRHYRDEDALSRRWAELRDLYFEMVDSVGYQRLDQPEIEFEIHRAFTRVKAALVLEMLRRSMDKDTHFVSALRRYISENKNTISGRAAFEEACENASERDWSDFLDAWLKSKGLPRYTLDVNGIDKESDQYTARLTVTITGNPVPMPVQVRFQFDSRDDENMVADIRDVTSEERDQAGSLTREFSFTVPAQPSEISLDPENRILKDPASALLWKAAGTTGQ